MKTFVNVKCYSYTYTMKSSIEVIVMTFTIVFGMSLFSWVLNFSPSMNDGLSIEAVIEREDEDLV
jgi:hypothetical protein